MRRHGETRPRLRGRVPMISFPVMAYCIHAIVHGHAEELPSATDRDEASHTSQEGSGGQDSTQQLPPRSLLPSWTEAPFPAERIYETIVKDLHQTFGEGEAPVNDVRVLDPVWTKILQATIDESSNVTVDSTGPEANENILPALAYECDPSCLADVASLQFLRKIHRAGPAETVRSIRSSLRPLTSHMIGVWKTCAVVGSAGQLSLDSLGEEIDQHGAVVRCNGAPTGRFASSVGNKTTILSLNNHALRLANKRSVQAWFEQHPSILLLNTVEAFVTPDFIRIARELHRLNKMSQHSDYKGPRVIAISGQFVKYATLVQDRSMVQTRSELQGLGNSDKIHQWYKGHKASGTWIIAMMRALCEKLDGYGFSHPGDTRPAPYHYYDSRMADQLDTKVSMRGVREAIRDVGALRRI
mmetsp:Transcript_11332/g.41467  ORF Transcript_11332/g.41467 Transcript_11332/m.41467 type:complete len:413 (+) Transcript_11332:102-1340(+)